MHPQDRLRGNMRSFVESCPSSGRTGLSVWPAGGRAVHETCGLLSAGFPKVQPPDNHSAWWSRDTRLACSCLMLFHGRLQRNGKSVAVGQRGLALLEALLDADGGVVSKADLICGRGPARSWRKAT